MAKKLIREGILEFLSRNEYERVGSKAELNTLYLLKIKEEVEEIINSNFQDIDEYADLLEVITSFAYNNGFNTSQVEEARVRKLARRGTFTNLVLTNLNPNNPSNRLYFESKKPTA